MARPTLALTDTESTALEEWSEELDVPLVLLWKEKRKAKELEAEVTEEKKGFEGHEDFEAGPTAAKIERIKSKKQQKKSAAEGPATRIGFDALGDDHVELKKEVQGLQGLVLDLKSQCKSIAHMLGHGERPAVKKARTKEKKEKSPPTVLVARPIPTSRLKGKTAASCSEWSHPFSNGSAELAASLWVGTAIMC